MQVFKTIPKPKVNVQMRWICLFSKSSWIITTAYGLSYELCVNAEKKVNENWDIVNKNGHNTFHTGKSGNVLMDLSKAFDTINHDLLFVKLHAYGFSNDTLQLLYIYLNNRWHKTKVNQKFS